MRDLIKRLEEETFNKKFGTKGKWVKVTSSVLKKNPEILDDLFGMLTKTYAPIGGHLKFKDASSLISPELSIFAVDVDDDPDADAFGISKKKPAGSKSVASGSDGTRAGKDAVIKRSASNLKTRGYFAEMSKAIAHIMLTRFNVNSVDNKEDVERVLGKKVEWLGEHPQGKYPKNKGWYKRKIGGSDQLKILLGLPKV